MDCTPPSRTAALHARPRAGSHLWAALLCLAAWPVWAATDSPYQPAELECKFQGKALVESSGLASAGRSDDYFFTHNDSGDAARFFAVSRKGETLATFKVPGAQSVDWEDMARGVDAAGAPVLFFGDTGDNAAKRSHLTVYQVPEPLVDPTRTGLELESAPAVALDLVFPDSPRDVEALMVHPRTRQLFLVSKSVRGSGVFAAPQLLVAGEKNVLRKIADIDFEPLPRTVRGLKDVIASVLITGGAISPDGSRCVVRTYTDAYEWKIEGERVAAAFEKPPVHVPLPDTRQGEAITYLRDGSGLRISSEGAGAPVHLLRRK